MRLKVLRSSADLQLYDSEFLTELALTQNAFADNVSDIQQHQDTVSNSLSLISRSVLVNDVRQVSRSLG